MRKIKEWNDYLERRLSFLKVTSHGYVVNKVLTRAAFATCLVLMIVAAVIDGPQVLFGSVYAYCPEDGSVCKNPFYDPLCQPAFMDCEPAIVPPGWSSGRQPSWLTKNFVNLVISICSLAVGLNHLLYNRSEVK